MIVAEKRYVVQAGIAQRRAEVILDEIGLFSRGHRR
jgi:hypothetical protein